MEIPDAVMQTILESMSDSYLEEDLPIEKDSTPEKVKKVEQIPKNNKPVRRFKSNPTIIETTTVLFSKEGKYRALVQSIFNDIDDGNFYRVDVTGRTFTSHRLAINHARKWLQKKRMKYYKKHPKKRPRIKTVRINPKPTKSKVKVINKLYKMEKNAAKILVRMSGKKLKLHDNYSRKKFDSKKTTAVSGKTTDFNTAIYNVMADGTKKERKLVAKMLKKFTHEPYRRTNLFY